MGKAKLWTKAREFSGVPTREDFSLEEEDLPPLQDGGKAVVRGGCEGGRLNEGYGV